MMGPRTRYKVYTVRIGKRKESSKFGISMSK